MDEAILKEYYAIIRGKILSAGFYSALGNIDKLLANFPMEANAYYYRGVCNFALDKYDDALYAYKKAIALDIAHAKAYFNLGVVYYMQEDYDNALINIGKSLIIFTKQKELKCKERCVEALNHIQSERENAI